MLFTDKQSELWLKWFKRKYEPYCTVGEDGKLSIPTIHTSNVARTEKWHRNMWLEEVRKIMGEDARKIYTHKGGRRETRAKAQLAALWLYCGPHFISTTTEDAE